MADLNLDQIIKKLDEEFSGDTRKLVFWYDDNGDFVDDIDQLALKNAKVHRLTPTDQFRTKLLLERQDKTTNYLLYAPFPKPPVEQNHLEDTLLYSKRFYADRASLVCIDLGIPERYKPVIQKYIDFFGEKRRTQRFYDLEMGNFTEETIEIALMSALCQSKVASFEEVVRILLTDDGGLDDNKFLSDIARFGLLDAFWKQCENSFGYVDDRPSLEKLVITLFVTYTARYMKAGLPQAWTPFISYKPGNVMVFLDSLMNNLLYRDSYDRLSAHVEANLSADKTFAHIPVESFIECDTFLCIDRILLSWLNERLVNEDTGAKLDRYTILEICDLRQKKHFSAKTGTYYALLESAWHLIDTADYQPETRFKDIQKKYIDQDHMIDTWYRKFIFYLDRLEDAGAFEKLRGSIEGIYTNGYLAKLLPAWNMALRSGDILQGIPHQRDFYNARVRNVKERVAVIISDGMRFEVGKALAERLGQDPNSTVSLNAQLSVLPSYTALGMAALLPHKTIEMTEDHKILADGRSTADLSAREAILRSYQPLSCCIRFDELKHMKGVAELRSVFTGKQVVYVYHDQIDARGESLRTEDEVFDASDEAIDEIAAMIHRIATSGNTYRFIVTSDHGFLYKRDALDESDKISNRARKGALLDRRYIIDQAAVVDEGVVSIALGTVLGNDDMRQVSFPVSTNVFKTGGGMNYVHGGSSPQEMIVPILDIKMERYHMETRTVQIGLISIVRKITNLITSLDLIQTEPVSDTVKSTRFRIYFIAEDGLYRERITNEEIMTADSRSEEPAKRIARLRFTFKNKRYDPSKHYYLVAYDEKNDLEAFRQEVVIDIAFADDFGFGS